MNKCFLFLILFLLNISFTQTIPDTGTYQYDSLVVKEILSLNWNWSWPEPTIVSTVTKVENNRISELLLPGLEIDTVPPSIGFLTYLKKLNLENNQIKQLPPEIGHLTNLTSLLLGGPIKAPCNPLDSGSCNDYDPTLPRNNLLTNLPNEIVQLSKLDTLDVFFNQLTALPDEIGNLTNLKLLAAGLNFIDSLPTSITALKNLSGLRVGGNKLKVLPQGLESLSSLKRLSVGVNNLTSLPDSIVNLDLTEGLDIDINKLCTIPSQIESWINTYSNNPDWKETQNCDSIRIETNNIQNKSASLTISPNPFKSTVRIRGEGKIFIYDIGGREVHKGKIRRGDSVIWNAAGMTSGVYLLKARMGKKTYSRKLILNR